MHARTRQNKVAGVLNWSTLHLVENWSFTIESQRIVQKGNGNVVAEITPCESVTVSLILVPF